MDPNKIVMSINGDQKVQLNLADLDFVDEIVFELP